MSDKPKKINLAGYYHTESTTPSWDGSSTLTILGRSPGGQRIDVVLTVSAIGLGYLGREVRKALKKHETAVADALELASGDAE